MAYRPYPPPQGPFPPQGPPINPYGQPQPPPQQQAYGAPPPVAANYYPPPQQQQNPAAALEFHLFNAPYLSLPTGVRRVVRTADCLLKTVRTGVAAVGRWHGKALKNVAYANCVLGYTRLDSDGRRLFE